MKPSQCEMLLTAQIPLSRSPSSLHTPAKWRHYGWTIKVSGLVARRCTIQLTSLNVLVAAQQGHLYNKDAHCPPQWTQWVQSAGVLPAQLCPGSRHDLFRHLTEAVK